ncbi:MAG: M1 family metallopeptidase [Ignavibacteria bacterium]|nr:M1 family metallopeptidase [Ignavibacteria bacterium]
MKLSLINLLLLMNFLFATNFNQKVHYKIDAELIPANKILKVKSLMTYQNNSPDELKELYIHIYWNLYSKNSYARKLAERRKDYYSQETKDVEIKKVKLIQSDKVQENVYELDNTVMRVPLINPLKPGETLQLEIELEEEVPPEGLRMGYYKRNFSIAHWFPSVCVYDKYGWHKDQYLGTGEFFEEYSDFEVNLTLPKTYLVFHTGTLINPNEVYDQSILSQLEKAKSSEQSTRIFEPKDKIQINDELKKTWRMKAENVRTFAFACFEDYLWDASSVNGILVHTVYPKQLESYYKIEGMKAARHAIKFLSEKIGPYVYPQMFVTVGGSTGGMEYPGIVFMGRGQIGGIMAKNTSSVIIHEICHNWFPMMLNSNEVEYAFMDEGFTTFMTTLAIEELYGEKNNKFNLEGWLAKVISNTDERTSSYAEVVRYLKTGYTEPVITHSDRYEQTNAYYVNSYPRTAMNLFMLQYLMGNQAFDELWKEYYKRFLFKKVYPEDFFNLVDEIYQKNHSQKSLRWFFDQWFYKDYKLDLSLKKFKVKKEDDKYITTIGIQNNEQAIMPCDVEIEFKDGTKQKVYFDYNDFAEGSNYIVKKFEFDKKPIKAEINPDKRLLDINRLNNTSGFIPITISRKPLLDLAENPYKYRLMFSPYFWFNNVDKLKFGLNLEGNYLGNEKTFELTLSKGMKEKAPLSGEIKLGDRLDFLGRLAYGTIRYFNLEGRRGAQLSVEKIFARYFNRNPQFRIKLSANYFDAYDDRYFDKEKFDYYFSPPVLPGAEWVEFFYSQRKFLFTSTNFTYTNNWEYFSTKFDVYYEAGTFRENVKEYLLAFGYGNLIKDVSENKLYQKLSISFIQTFKPKSFLTSVKFRQFIGVTPRKLPKAREFYLATVNPIDEFNLPLYRTYGILSRNYITNHSIPNGDGFMRGFYKNNISDDFITTFNSEINFTKTLSYLGTIGNLIAILNPKFFFDIGNVWHNQKAFNFKALKYDWGLSISPLPQIDERIASELQKLNPLTKLGINDFRIDFPLFISHPPLGEKKFEFRWLVGLRSEL